MVGKFIEEHNIGETATVKEYSVLDPSPSSWNSDKSGSGYEYIPKNTFVVTQDTDIYGQYKNPTVYYHFFQDDEKIISKSDKWNVYFGQTIQVPEYKYENFVCWNINSACYFPEQEITINEDTHFLPSCNYDLVVSFDSNGGYGEMEDMLANTGKYINSSISTVYEYSTITLPENQFLIEYYLQFDKWVIDEVEYSPGDRVQITKDTVVVAKWKSKPLGAKKRKRKTLKANREQYPLEIKSNNNTYGFVSCENAIEDKIKTISAFSRDSDFYDFEYWKTSLSEIKYEENPLSVEFEDTNKIEVMAFFKLGDRHTTVSKTNGKQFFVRPKQVLTREDVKNTEDFDYSIARVNIGTSFLSVGDGCFSRCYSLKNVTGCENIRFYGEKSFYGNTMDSIDFISSNNDIIFGGYSFYNSDVLKLIVPENCKTMGNNIFEKCNKLTDLSIFVSSDVQIFQENSFNYCPLLSSLTYFNNGGTTVFQDNVFQECYNLKTIDFSSISSLSQIPQIQDTTFPENECVSDRVFKFKNSDMSLSVAKLDGWDSFKEQFIPEIDETVYNEITISSSLSGNITLRFGLVEDCYIQWGDGTEEVYSKNSSVVLRHKYTNSGVYTIRINDSINRYISIRDSLSVQLSTVNQFGSNVSAIWDYCFSHTNLRNIYIPERIKYIGTLFVNKCSNIQYDDDSIRIEGGSIVQNAWFTYRDENQNVILSRLRSDGDKKKLVIGNSVQILANHSIDFDENVSSIHIPSSVQNIKPGAIRSICESSEMEVEGLVYRLSSNCIVENESNKLVAGYMSSNFPSDISSLGAYSLYNTKERYIKIPRTIKTLNYASFGGMKNLVCVDFTEMNLQLSAVKGEIMDNDLFIDCVVEDEEKEITVNKIKVKNGSDTFEVNVSSDGTLSIDGFDWPPEESEEDAEDEDSE